MGVAIITGASSGLGKSFANLLAKNPTYFGRKQKIDEFWLLGRNAEALAALVEECSVYAPLKYRVFVVDLEQRAELKSFCDVLADESPDVVALINNAGGGKFGPFHELPLAEAETMMAVNLRALVCLTHSALPYMRGGSRLIQIASSAGFAPLPGMAVYGATKAFVINFSRALRNELKSRGIVVTTVCPGAIMTDFFRKANEYVTLESPGKKFAISTPEEVAAKALRSAKRRKILSVYSPTMKLSHLLCKLLPHRLISWYWAKRT